MNQTDKLAIKVVVVLVAVVIVFCGFYLLSTYEVSRFSGADDYTVVISKRRYQGFTMRAPGDGGDAPGFIEIFDRSGGSYGRIPLPTLQMGNDVRWTSSGAEIPAVAEWDFKRHTCYYWSENQDRQIWVKR